MSTEVATQEAGDLTATAVLPSMIEAATSHLLARAKSIAVISDEGYVAASKFGTDVKAEMDKLEAERVSLKNPFLVGGKRIDDYFRGPIATLASAIELTKKAMTDYNAEKRRLAAIEQKRLDDEKTAKEAAAKKLADEAAAKIRAEERARLDAAEAIAKEERSKREAAEAEARQAAEALKAAEARAAGDRAAAEAADKRAADAKQQTDVATADAAEQRKKAYDAKMAQLRAEKATKSAISTMDTAQAEADKPVQQVASSTKVSGVATRTVWKWRTKPDFDLQAAIEDVVVPLHYVRLDDEKIDATVARLKDMAQESLHWLEIYSEESLALGTRGKK